MYSICLVSSGVGIQCGLDPGEVLVHLDVHAGVVGQSAALSPGHQAGEHSLTHQWASRVPLGGRGRGRNRQGDGGEHGLGVQDRLQTVDGLCPKSFPM